MGGICLVVVMLWPQGSSERLLLSHIGPLIGPVLVVAISALTDRT